MLVGRITCVVALASAIVSCSPHGAPRSIVTLATPSSTARSDANAKVLISALAAFDPEGLGEMGILGLDTEIRDLKPNLNARARERLRVVIADLEDRTSHESDSFVAEDLAILLRAARDEVRSSELEDKYVLPYHNVARMVFRGLHALLDDRLPKERRAAAQTRLERYAGIATGYTPLTRLAMDRTKEKLAVGGLLAPTKAEVEKDLADAKAFREGIQKLFAKYKLPGYEAPLGRLEEELIEYDAFVRAEILPRARVDYREPPELYAFQLHTMGVAVAPSELASKAHDAFSATQREMEALATLVARERGLSTTSTYRDVIRALKRESISGDALRSLYEARIRDLETIIRREQLVSLPARPMLFRMATEAETAAEPAPHIDVQGLFAKDTQLAFVLPQGLTHTSAGGAKTYDDFNFAAATWTLTAHEGRPGHELQFSQMAERGLSRARTLFAFNSVNVEGWGLYSEAIMRPFMPPEGRLISLQALLLREARAFLDPELQEGTQTIETARRVLTDDVVVSDAMAEQEIQRYTFDSPGQATSYFYGYSRLLELRRDTEQRFAGRFDAKAFHDFVLAQGLLPPPLLRSAVEKGFMSTPLTP
jgi:hypothetical protein